MYFNLSKKIINWLNKDIDVFNYTTNNNLIIEESFNKLVNLLKKNNLNIININKFKEEYIKYLYKYTYVA